ncbi:MAG: hypothetical protein ABJA82_11155, partial [Myxococcales bacterium]
MKKRLSLLLVSSMMLPLVAAVAQTPPAAPTLDAPAVLPESRPDSRLDLPPAAPLEGALPQAVPP